MPKSNNNNNNNHKKNSFTSLADIVFDQLDFIRKRQRISKSKRQKRKLSSSIQNHRHHHQQQQDINTNTNINNNLNKSTSNLFISINKHMKTTKNNNSNNKNSNNNNIKPIDFDYNSTSNNSINKSTTTITTTPNNKREEIMTDKQQHIENLLKNQRKLDMSTRLDGGSSRQDLNYLTTISSHRKSNASMASENSAMTNNDSLSKYSMVNNNSQKYLGADLPQPLFRSTSSDLTSIFDSKSNVVFSTFLDREKHEKLTQLPTSVQRASIASNIILVNIEIILFICI